MPGNVTLDGDKQLIATLRSLDAKSQRKVIRPFIAAQGKKLADVAKGNARRKLGLLAKSIGSKVQTRKNKVTAIVGPRVGFGKFVGSKPRFKFARRLKLSGLGRAVFRKKRFVDPVRYAGPLEAGHGGPHPAPPYPFLKPAFDQVSAEMLGDIKGGALMDNIAKLAIKK